MGKAPSGIVKQKSLLRASTEAWEAQTQRSNPKTRRKTWINGDRGLFRRSCLRQGHAAPRSIPSPGFSPAPPFSFHSICIIISSILSQEKQTSPSLPTTRRGMGRGVKGWQAQITKQLVWNEVVRK